MSPTKHVVYTRHKKIVHYILYIIVFCVILLLYVFEHIQALRYGYVIEKKRVEESVLTMENDQILMEIKQLTSLPRLEELAAHKLGLKEASHQDIIVLPIQPMVKQKKRKFHY